MKFYNRVLRYLLQTFFNGAFDGGLQINCVMAAKTNAKYSVQYYA